MFTSFCEHMSILYSCWIGFWYACRLEKSKWLPFSHRVDNNVPPFLFPWLQWLILIHPGVHQIMHLPHILHLKASNRTQGIPELQRIARFTLMPHVFTELVWCPFFLLRSFVGICINMVFSDLQYIYILCIIQATLLNCLLEGECLKLKEYRTIWFIWFRYDTMYIEPIELINSWLWTWICPVIVCIMFFFHL